MRKTLTPLLLLLVLHSTGAMAQMTSRSPYLPVAAGAAQQVSPTAQRSMPPTNDQCGTVTAQALAVGGSLTFTGTTVDATSTGDFAPGSAFSGSEYPTVWHAFTLAACADVTISYCNTTGGFGNVWAFLSPGCPAGDDYLLNTATSWINCPDNIEIQYLQLPAGTWYVPVLSDIEDAYGPYSIQATAAPCGSIYCMAGAYSTEYEKISNVTVAGINNSTTSTVGYENFTGITGNMSTGGAFPISVTISGGYASDQVLVWIDLDQDRVFSENELVFSATGVGPHTGTIVIPANATPGNTRMRVRLHDTADGPNATGCGYSAYGQVEDYTVNITNLPTPPNDNCSGAIPQALVVPGTLSLSGNNTGATVDPPTDHVLVWEAFTIASCANVTVNYCMPGSEFDDYFGQLVTNCSNIVTGLINGTESGCTVIFTSLPAGTYYIPVWVLPGNPQGIYTVGVSATACPVGTYCTAGATSESDEKIELVYFGGEIVTSSSNAGYEDHTATVMNVVRNSYHELLVSASDPYVLDQIRVWIDFDQNFSFEPNEEVFVSAIGTGPWDSYIFIPPTAALGHTRMRIRLNDTHDGSSYTNISNNTPCGLSTYGQVEDFTVNIHLTTDIHVAGDAIFKVYPNPTRGEITIDAPEASGVTSLEVYDMTGRIVHTSQFVFAGQAQTLSLQGVATGAYQVKLTNGDNSYSTRLIVE